MSLYWAARTPFKLSYREVVRLSLLQVFAEEQLENSTYQLAISEKLKDKYLSRVKVFNPFKYVELLLTFAKNGVDRLLQSGAAPANGQYGFFRSVGRGLADVVFGLPLYIFKHVSSPWNTLARPLIQDYKQNPKRNTFIVVLTFAVIVSLFLLSVAFSGGGAALPASLLFLAPILKTAFASFGFVGELFHLTGVAQMMVGGTVVSILSMVLSGAATLKVWFEIKSVLGSIKNSIKGHINLPDSKQLAMLKLAPSAKGGSDAGAANANGLSDEMARIKWEFDCEHLSADALAHWATRLSAAHRKGVWEALGIDTQGNDDVKAAIAKMSADDIVRLLSPQRGDANIRFGSVALFTPTPALDEPAKVTEYSSVRRAANFFQGKGWDSYDNKHDEVSRRLKDPESRRDKPQHKFKDSTVSEALFGTPEGAPTHSV
jgi:hypothetical protein